MFTGLAKDERREMGWQQRRRNFVRFLPVVASIIPRREVLVCVGTANERIDQHPVDSSNLVQDRGGKDSLNVVVA